MKILYGINVTGYGHVARSKEIISELKKHADVDVLLSGTHKNIDIGHKVKYRKGGFPLIFNEKGALDMRKTLRSAKIIGVIKDIATLDLKDYDLVVSDFEFVTIWAAKVRNKPSVGISNQYSLLSTKLESIRYISPTLEIITRLFAKCDKNIAINYKSLEPSMYTPVIREKIRNAKPTNGNHITVYLPYYGERYLTDIFRKIKDVDWHIFSQNIKRPRKFGNVYHMTFSNDEFAKSLISSKGIITGGGFATTSEALYLGKKLLVVPLGRQPEQKINARILKTLGVKSIRRVGRKFPRQLRDWLKNSPTVQMDYPNVAPEIAKEIINFKKQYR